MKNPHEGRRGSEGEYNKRMPEKVPTPAVGGYPDKNVKTSGIQQRGYGAAVKGFTSRGPLA